MNTEITAAVWNGTTFELRPFASPDLSLGELLVRVDLATVCGSDRHTVSGRRPTPTPVVLGHEAVGTVVATGASPQTTVDARIVWSVVVGCGRCHRCAAGRSAKCVTLRKIGHEPLNDAWPLSGSFATHIVLPATAKVIEVPVEVPDELAAPASCATATVMAAAEVAGTLRDKRVLICGAGMLGITAAAWAHHSGATQVTVTDPSPERRAQALRFGATEALSPEAPLDKFDVAFEVSGARSAAVTAFSALDVYGRLVLVGAVAPGPPAELDLEHVVRNWTTVTGVHNYEPRHLHEAIDFLACTRDIYAWRTLVTHGGNLGALPSQ